MAVGTNVHHQWMHLSNLYTKISGLLPYSIRGGLERLLQADPGGDATLSSTVDLLHAFSPEVLLAFPPYFDTIYSILGSIRHSLQTRRPEVLRRRIGELAEHGDDALSMVIPAFEQMLSHPDSVETAIDLFDRIAYYFGRHLTAHRILPIFSSLLHVCKTMSKWKEREDWA